MYDEIDNIIESCIKIAKQKKLDTSFLLSNERYLSQDINKKESCWSAGISNPSKNLPLGEIIPQYEATGETPAEAIQNLITLLVNI